MEKAGTIDSRECNRRAAEYDVRLPIHGHPKNNASSDADAENAVPVQEKPAKPETGGGHRAGHSSVGVRTLRE